MSAPPRPKRATLDVQAFPAPLRGRDQWATFRYGFRDGSWTKIPKQASGPDAGKNAKSNDPSTWSSFQDALNAFEADPTLDGIGYFFAEDDPYCFVDIDKVKSSPERLAWALGLVKRFGTYAEWSVSGNGLHIIGEGRMPDADGTPQKGRNDQAKGLEAYSQRRFATFTGKVVEGAPTALVDVQEQLDRLLATEFKPKDADRPVSRPTVTPGPIATTDRIERIKERMFGGPRGDQLRRLYAGDAGDYRKADGSPDWSGADLSLCSGAWYYADSDAATVEAIWLASGLASARPNGSKLDRADYRQSTLRQAAGSKTYRDTHGYSAWEDPPRIQFKPKPPEAKPIGGAAPAPCPSDQPATLEDALALIAQLRQENAELSRSNLELLGWVDRTAGFVEELQACNATLSRKLDQERAERAVDRRMELARRRLRSVKSLKPAQKDVIEASARILTRRAEYFGTDSPIMTGEHLAKEIGMYESSARDIAEKVCGLEGSPIRRHTDYRRDGKRGKITTYTPEVLDPVEIIERFATIGEQLDAKDEKVTRTAVRCDKHPKARLNVFTERSCSVCGKIVVSDVSEREGLYEQLARIEPPPPTVDDYVPTTEQLARIAEAPETADTRAGAMVGTPASKSIDPWKRPESRERPEPVNLGRIRFERDRHQEAPSTASEVSGPRCGHVKPNGRECVATMYRDHGGGLRHCLGCGTRTALAMMGAEE